MPADGGWQRKCGKSSACFWTRSIAAEHSIYIENQFFTSSLVAEHIAKRMQEGRTTRFCWLDRRTTSSWVEARTMRNGRIRFMRTLTEAGVA